MWILDRMNSGLRGEVVGGGREIMMGRCGIRGLLMGSVTQSNI